MNTKNILETIGNTPLVELSGIDRNYASSIYGKLEFMNPSGSVKDRMALYIIENAERKGYLKPGGTIIENSSGNTGSSLAMIAAVKGYNCIITMPDKMSDEKKRIMEAFGAEVIVSPTNVPADSPQSYYSVASKLAGEIENSYYPDQYNNPLNIEAHYKSTGPEIWEQTSGKIDILVGGVGTGGTLSGCGRFLKERNKKIKIIAVDPEGSVFYDYFKSGKLIEPMMYKVEGIGEDYLVKGIDFTVIDEFVRVNDENSFLMTKRLAVEEGIFAGGSSGSALWAANKIGSQIKEKKNIVVIFPDSGDRYLSKIYNNLWMKENGYNGE